MAVFSAMAVSEGPIEWCQMYARRRDVGVSLNDVAPILGADLKLTLEQLEFQLLQAQEV